MNTIKTFFYGITCLALSSYSLMSQADTTANLNASLDVSDSCRIISIADVSFGTYTGTTINKTLPVTFQCTKKASSVVVKLDCGKNGYNNSGVCVRSMKNTNQDLTANNLLNYKVFSNSGYTTELTNSFVATSSRTGTNQTVTFYPSLISSQYTAVYGNYSDDVTITAVF